MTTLGGLTPESEKTKEMLDRISITVDASGKEDLAWITIRANVIIGLGLSDDDIDKLVELLQQAKTIKLRR